MSTVAEDLVLTSTSTLLATLLAGGDEDSICNLLVDACMAKQTLDAEHAEKTKDLTTVIETIRTHFMNVMADRHAKSIPHDLVDITGVYQEIRNPSLALELLKKANVPEDEIKKAVYFPEPKPMPAPALTLDLRGFSPLVKKYGKPIEEIREKAIETRLTGVKITPKKVEPKKVN